MTAASPSSSRTLRPADGPGSAGRLVRVRDSAQHPGQIPINVSARMKAAIDAVPYASAVKFGLQFSRRFWERTSTFWRDHLHRSADSADFHPSTNFNAGGKGVLLGGYTFDGANS